MGTTTLLTENRGVFSVQQESSMLAFLSGTRTNVNSISVPKTGTYIINGHIRFENDGNGYRRISLGTSSGGTQLNQVTTRASNLQFDTRISVVDIEELTEGTTVYLSGVQNSGSTLTAVDSSIDLILIG